VAAESGQQRALRFRQLEAECLTKADSYRRQAEACEKGNAGEQLVAGLLDTLDGAGWVVLHDRYKSPTSPANLDHVVIGPPGVVVIDAKNWVAADLQLDDRGMRAGRWRRDDELRAGWQAGLAVQDNVVSVEAGAPVRAVLAFTQPMGLARPQEHQGVVLLQAEQLLVWLTSQPGVLSQQQVHRLGSSLGAALPPRSGPRRPFTIEAVGHAARSQRREPHRGPGRAGARTSRARPVVRARHRYGELALRAVVLMMFCFWLLPLLLQGLMDSVVQSATVAPTP